MTARLHPWQYSGMSPTQRTLRWLEEHGWTAEVVERWIPKAKVRRDCFGCDVLACNPDAGIALVQVCGEDVAAHVRKVRDNPDARTFVEAGGEVLVMGWRELKETGWTPRIWSMTEEREFDVDEVLESVEWQPRLVA